MAKSRIKLLREGFVQGLVALAINFVMLGILRAVSEVFPRFMGDRFVLELDRSVFEGMVLFTLVFWPLFHMLLGGNGRLEGDAVGFTGQARRKLLRSALLGILASFLFLLTTIIGGWFLDRRPENIFGIMLWCCSVTLLFGMNGCKGVTCEKKGMEPPACGQGQA